MAKILFVRMAGVVGLTSLALFFVSLLPFLSANPTAGAGLAARTPAFSVNREFKGDRLPLPSDVNSAVSRVDTRTRPSRQIPVGCEPAFSPVSSPQLAYYFGRCTT